MLQILLMQAPQGFIPNCETEHTSTEMLQTFPGGKVRMNYDKTTGTATAYVDGRPIGTWKDLTIRTWGDILYTLQTTFNHIISKL